jgi:ATP:ADP antiporter, AAA family
MKDNLSTLFRNNGQESKVSMLLAQSLFLGFFFGAFDIIAYSLLLSEFNEKMMARGFLLSGALSMVLFYFNSKLKITLRNTLLICSVIALIIWGLLTFSYSKWLVLIMFILTGPLNIFAFSIARETISRLNSDNKESTDFLSDAGMIAGTILISFLIPVILSFHFSPVSILLPGAISLFAAAFFNYRMSRNSGIPDPRDTGNSFAFVNFNKYPLVRIMAIFAGISILTGFIIQYSFLALANGHYHSTSELASFLGLFTGTIMIVSGFVKWILFPGILHKYGIRICFLFPPAVIALSAIVALIVGAVAGVSSHAFFVLAAVSAFLSTVLILSVLTPSFKVIYRSLDKRLSNIIQTNTNSWQKPFPLLISGIFLTAFSYLDFSLLYYSVILITPVLIWMYIAYRIHDIYKKQISHISINKESGFQVIEDSLNQRFAGYLQFKGNYYNLISGDFSILNKTKNKWYFEEIIDYSWSKKDINLVPVLKKTSFIPDLDEGIKRRSSEVLEILQKKNVYFKYTDDKIAEAVKILSGARMPHTSQILSLLRNNSVESKRLAIFMIGKFQLTDLLSVVCDCLNTPGLTCDAYEVLKSFGPEAEKELIRFYLVSAGNPKLSKLIIQLLGNAGTKGATGFLFSRLWSNSRQLKEIILKFLLANGFKPSDDEKHRLDQLASEVIGTLAWNLAAKTSLEKENDKALLDSIDRETERWENFLFNILSVSYGSQPVLSILHNSKDTTIEGVVATLDLTDAIISPYLSPRLKALLDFPEKTKIKKLSRFYSVEILSHEKLLEDILNRDYNLISLWTKALSLRGISKIAGAESEQNVLALLFSPEEMIREETARLIGRTRPDLFYSASQRLPDTTRSGLEKIINKTTNERQLLFEKVLFLTRFFKGIPEDDLISLASEMKYIVTFGGETLKSGDGCIVWPLNTGNDEVYIMYNVESDIPGRRFSERHDLSFYILALPAIEEYHFRFPEESREILKYIDQNQT